MTSTGPISKPKTTFVQLAEGRTIAFEGAVSRFIVANPKKSVIIAAVVFNLVGVFLHF